MESVMAEEVTTVRQFLPIWEWSSMPDRVIPIGSEWTAAKGVPQPLFGWWSICWGVLCEILYIPCSVALFKERRHPCYRIMLWLAIVDMIAIMCSCICFGFLLIEGAVFCSRPWLIWIVGCFGLGMWCGACIGCLMLITYRLYELMNMGRRFEAQTNVLICVATCYTLYFTLFTPPVLTNSESKAMFFDPFIEDNSKVVYVNWAHTANNLLIVLSSAILYIRFCIMLLTKQAEVALSEAGRARIAANAPIFIQASLICVFNVAASLEYIYMNFFPAPEILIEFGHVSWQLTHGAPPFIYLLLNKTIKKHFGIFFEQKKKIEPLSVFYTNFEE